jgi:hypothetical protein
MHMLSTDYSQLFSSGIRMLGSRSLRPRRASQPPAPPLVAGVSYISFEPDTPLSPAPSAPLLGARAWRNALRRMSMPAGRRARRTTMPADFVLRPDAASTWGAKRDPAPLPVFPYVYLSRSFLRGMYRSHAWGVQRRRRAQQQQQHGHAG